ncbi:MAG: hypothetical protein GY791_10010 [Alphaproteobacteria bacterium]|nr:hypothetical protein [Alphaproteobacteria bacterium]
MKRLVFPVLIAIALAGCEGGPEYWTGAEAQHKNSVEWVMIDHDVMFAPGGTTLSAEERGRLQSFLDRHDADPTLDQVFVEIGGASGGSVGQQRQAAIDRILRFNHLVSEPGPSSSPAAIVPDEHVTVTLARYIVVPPNCPDWRKPSRSDPNNTVSSNYGCATEANLGLMVADPRDLIVGRAIGPSDASVNAAVVSRYRQGKAKKAKAPSTK